jgi:ABC-type sugar transport system substrate-binding protein
MKKRLIFSVLSLIILGAVVLSACAPAAPAEEAPVVEEAAEEEVVEEEVVEEEAAPEMIEIALIIKATDSGFWQAAIKGGEAFGADNDNVNVTIYGPASESDSDEQLAILETVILSEVDAIVIASNLGEGAVAALKDAAEKGSPRNR